MVNIGDTVYCLDRDLNNVLVPRQVKLYKVYSDYYIVSVTDECNVTTFHSVGRVFETRQEALYKIAEELLFLW